MRISLRGLLVLFLCLPALPAAAQSAPDAQEISRCFAYVQKTPHVVPAGFTFAQATTKTAAKEVTITYATHSTFRITTPEGVVLATDYAGWAGEGPLPTVVTMNHAHETHYTDYVDPGIPHVLRGWNPAGGPAEHKLRVKDVLIRNVPTDIKRWEGHVEPFGNSIFIFEVADLCIGHLGHLHHKPTPEQFAKIGRLDILFVPVDGSFTLNQPDMIEVVKKLRTSLVIPMHYFGGDSLRRFIAGLEGAFQVEVLKEPTTVVSLTTLPRRPTLRVLPGY
jgi:L-ascorbate metabolism protein UlaG (beta-lactamase superfamily)